VKREAELPTASWAHVFEEAAAAGVLQADLTGGEPLVRTDIVELVKAGRRSGLYISLITSGIPLTEAKLAAIVESGLDHFQLSFQGATEQIGQEISDSISHAQKLEVLRWLKRHHVGVTLNFVIHRRNIHELTRMIEIVKEHQPGCAEFASVQYYGWALANRDALLPTRTQVDYCVETLKSAERELRGTTRIVFVVPDYYAKYPKACVGGWGRRLILVSPEGTALPCHAAKIIPGLRFDNVKDKPIKEIWENSTAFRQFRGEDWMQEPCKSCERRQQDFGGCRCQSFIFSGDAAITDPVCSLAPTRHNVNVILTSIGQTKSYPSEEKSDYVYRGNPG
jgi:pyrroloquinoline quinone biosynthesis protein E